MKKILSILAIAGIMMLAGCGNENPADHPVVGHTYSTNTEQIYFAADGSAVLNSLDANGIWYEYPFFTYEIKGNKIEVYNDNSDNWKDSAKGKLNVTFTYKSNKDVLIDESGNTWHRFK